MYEIIASHKKLFLRLEFQNIVANEISALQNNLIHSSVSSSDKSSNTLEGNSPIELYYILGIDITMPWCDTKNN